MEISSRADVPRRGPEVPLQGEMEHSSASKSKGDEYKAEGLPLPFEDLRTGTTTGLTGDYGTSGDTDATKPPKSFVGEYHASHIREEGAGMRQAGMVEEDVSTDRVRLLVGSFNVGNSPMTELAPWLPEHGKGFDLIVVGLQESTYRAPRGGRDSPTANSCNGSPTASPIRPGSSTGSPTWSGMNIQALDASDTPPPGEGMFSPFPSQGQSSFPAESSLSSSRPGSVGDAESTGGIALMAAYQPSKNSLRKIPADGGGSRGVEAVRRASVASASVASASVTVTVSSVSESKESSGVTLDKAPERLAMSRQVTEEGRKALLAKSPVDGPPMSRNFNSGLPPMSPNIFLGNARSSPAQSNPPSVTSTPSVAPGTLSVTMPSTLPIDREDWEIRSGATHERTSFSEDFSAVTTGSFPTSAKDLTRFGRARKAVKKRTKELDAGAAHLRSMLHDHLGEDFVQVISQRRMQMRLKIFLHKKLLPVYDREEGESTAENTGIGKVVANKGGLVGKLRLKGTTLCFVSCHLQAHEGQNHLARRNASCAEILQGARLGDRRHVDVDSQFHHVFWFGDMNYRINFGLPSEEQHTRVESLVKQKNWPKLWEGDELLRELKAGRVLAGFLTEPPAFAPTFKTVRGEQEGYSSKRVPSYTDRILWKSLPGHAANLDLLEFKSFPEITSSDHKPIHASFSVKLTPELKPPPTEEKKRGCRKARVLDLPRAQHLPARLVFEDLEASGLAELTGGGGRNPFIKFSSDPKHLLGSGKPVKTEVKRKTLNPRWTKKYTCHLSIGDLSLLRHSHVSLVLCDRDVGSKHDLVGVANLSLADVIWSSFQPRHSDQHSPLSVTRKRSRFSRRRSMSPQGSFRSSRYSSSHGNPRSRSSTVNGEDWKSDSHEGEMLSRHGSNPALGQSNLPMAARASSGAKEDGGPGGGEGGGGGGVVADKHTTPTLSTPRPLRRPKSFGGSLSGPWRLLRRGPSFYSDSIIQGSAVAGFVSTPVTEGGASVTRSTSHGTPRLSSEFRLGQQHHVREGLEFDVPLLKHGLQRGRIRGRCILVSNPMRRIASLQSSCGTFGDPSTSAAVDVAELSVPRHKPVHKVFSSRFSGRSDSTKLTIKKRVFGPASSGGGRGRSSVGGDVGGDITGRQIKKSASARPDVLRLSLEDRERDEEDAAWRSRVANRDGCVMM